MEIHWLKSFHHTWYQTIWCGKVAQNILIGSMFMYEVHQSNFWKVHVKRFRSNTLVKVKVMSNAWGKFGNSLGKDNFMLKWSCKKMSHLPISRNEEVRHDYVGMKPSFSTFDWIVKAFMSNWWPNCQKNLNWKEIGQGCIS